MSMPARGYEYYRVLLLLYSKSNWHLVVYVASDVQLEVQVESAGESFKFNFKFLVTATGTVTAVPLAA